MPAMPATFVAAALAVVIFKNLRRGILVMVSSHSFVTDVTHDRLTGVGSKRLIAEQQLEVCRHLPCIRGPSTEAVVLQSARTDGRHWPRVVLLFRSHVFKSAF